MSNCNIELTKEEIKSLVHHVGARIGELRLEQVRVARSGNVKKVLELEEFMKTAISANDKLMRAVALNEV